MTTLRLLAWTIGTLTLASAIRRLSYHSGARHDEVHGPLPGDDVIAHPMAEWTRATTVQAGPDAIWPWLVQMGYGRGGWYTNERLDRLVWGVSAPTMAGIRPDLQELRTGDIVADGPDHAAYFHVAVIEPARAIVYYSVRHPFRGHPLSDTDDATLAAMERQLRDGGHYLEFSWAFVLTPMDTGHTRLVIRTRAVYAPRWLSAVVVPLGWVDLFHAHTMLLGIKRRAEQYSQG